MSLTCITYSYLLSIEQILQLNTVVVCDNQYDDFLYDASLRTPPDEG